MRRYKTHCIRGHKRTEDNIRGHNNKCIKCAREQGIEYYHKNKEKLKIYGREYRIKSQYGVDLKWYENQYKIQDGLCAICHKPQKEGIKSLAIDHNHKTGKVRELLCRACNRGIGVFRENPDVLQSAKNYLLKHNES